MIGKRKKITVIIVLMIFSTSFLFINEKKVESIDPFFTLVALSPHRLQEIKDIGFNYLEIIKQQLLRLGINLEIVYGCGYDSCWFNSIFFFHDFDLVYLPFNYIYGFQNPTIGTSLDFYCENGSLNFSGYNTEMDYDEQLGTGKNEWFLNTINSISSLDDTDKYELSWDWQMHLMDKILPCYPLFAEKDYLLIYDNLKGINFQDGLLQSWGKLTWDGTHKGQLDINEIIVSDNSWTNLNPLNISNYYYSPDDFITSFILEPLIWRDSDYTYWPHLASEWIQIDNNHVRLNLRENIKWQNDLAEEFPNEYFDAEDIYFTLYMNKLKGNLLWINDFKIIDSKTIDLFVEKDQTNFGNGADYYLGELYKIKILPEHYLNQTQLIDGKTPDITHTSWFEFSKNPFGTGLMKLKDYRENIDLILTLFNECWWLNTELTQETSLNWKTRFGEFLNSPEQLRIKILENNQREYEFFLGKIDVLPRKMSEIIEFEKKQEIYNTIEILSKISNRFSVIGFNMRPMRDFIGNPIPTELYPNMTKGLAIRKAISYAIDREEINEIVHGGEMVLNNYPISSSMNKWLNPDMITYCQNYIYARAFLRTAGFDTCWRGPPLPEGFPDWRDACSPTN
ncbi:MAG: hypothetical protein FK731_14870, partial [Asgard group archaeon]|nr:hypothetical protein [Asgard group archaeon]